MMRNRFDAQLEVLNTELIRMGALCENAIAAASKALVEGGADLCQQAVSLERDIDAKERDIEDLCLRLLLQQQPVARDLRLISAAMKMITDMERIGDQAADIAEIITMGDLRVTEEELPLADMARTSIQMVTDSIDAFVRRDLELSRAVIARDDVVDALFTDVRHLLIVELRRSADVGARVIDMLMIAKYLERIGDHATNIAEWVVFSITGEHKEPDA